MRLLLAAVAAAIGGVAMAAEPPPLEAYGRLPTIEDMEISPKGDRVAFITVDGEKRQLVLHPLVGTVRHRLDAGQVKVRWLDWAGDDHLLITTSSTAWLPQFRGGKHEWFQVVAYNLPRQKLVVLMGDTPDTLNVVMGEPMVATHRGEPKVFVRGVTLTGEGSYDLYRVDLDNGRGRIHARGHEDVSDWIVAPDGEPLARLEHDDRRGVAAITTRKGAGWREIGPAEAEDEAVAPLGLGRTEGTIFVSRREGDRRRLHELRLEDGALGAPLDKAGKTWSGVLYDPTTRRPLAISYLDQSHDYDFFDPAHHRAWRSARVAFKGSHVSLQSWTPDFRKLVLLVEGPDDAGTYYLVDVEAKKADLLADAWPQVRPGQIGEVRWTTYKAADGLEIPAYLTLPPGREAKNLPLVVLPHGGPESRDAPGFDWWAQAFASRGYAVLKPQFRGSDGFGRKFVEAGYGEWGRRMQTDLSDGVRHLAKEGVIDPKRVCIMGASYGGYAALAGPTLDPGVYRCAVSVNGVGDLAGMLAQEARDVGRVNTAAVRYWSRFMGASYRKRGELDAVSPTRQAARADAPILVIHGKDDTVVPYAQSADFVRAMQRAGKPVEFVTLAGEDHWLSRGATRLQMLRSAMAFVEKHNPPQ